VNSSAAQTKNAKSTTVARMKPKSPNGRWVVRNCGHDCVVWSHSRRVLCWHEVEWLRRVTTRKRGRLTNKDAAAAVGVHPTLIPHIHSGRVWREHHP
jgi:hypothetical protein